MSTTSTHRSRTMTAEPSPARLCRTLADLLNRVDEIDDRGLLNEAEALLHPLGVAGWPLDVTSQRVLSWGLSTREAAGLIDGLRQLGVEL
jgi:hypothetical protein